MTIKTLSKHKHANAYVCELHDGAVVLVSYETQVIIVSDAGWLRVTGLYSATTRKHISWFLREYYGLSYQLAKQLCEDGMQYNVRTGEFKRTSEM